MKSNINFNKQDLSNNDFSNMDLSNLDLSHKNLSKSIFRNTICKNTCFFGSNLFSCEFDNTDVTGANFGMSDLRFTKPWKLKNLDKAFNVPMINPWFYGITGNKITIGCQTKTIKEWDEWFESDKIISCDRESKHFKYIKATFLGMKAYFEYLNLKNYDK